MHDTIDLLEAIGQDASLRYADGETLANHGAIETASEALKGAILRGSRADLLAELGLQPLQATQISQMPRREEEDPEEGDEPSPDKPRLARKDLVHAASRTTWPRGESIDAGR